MAHKAFIVGGAGATITLDDVLKVVHGSEVALDHSASDRVKKESPPPKAFQAEDAPAHAPAVEACLDPQQTRAVLLYKLLSLINGRSRVRLAVVEALAGILNAQLWPCMPVADTDQQALSALAAILQGVGHACGGAAGRRSIADTFAAAGLAAPGLSAAERAVVEDGQSAAGGTGAICVQAGKQLLAVANAVAALSAEALQADVSTPILPCSAVLCCCQAKGLAGRKGCCMFTGVWVLGTVPLPLQTLWW
jgi:histidine ammonia-lyase